VRGHKTYPTKGDLRLTTVSVTNPTHRIGLGEAMAAWFDGARAVYPRDVIYPPEQSAEDVQTQSAVEMVSSQDTAVAAALHELGYRLPLRVEIVDVTKGAPADGSPSPTSPRCRRPSSAPASARPPRSSYAGAGWNGPSRSPRRRPRTTRPRRS
jgi:hypothetical protein